MNNMESRRREFDDGSFDAAFFVEDMVSYVLQWRRIRWASPRIDLPQVRPRRLSYSFTPQMGRAIMYYYSLFQEDIARHRDWYIEQIAYIQGQNVCSLLYSLFKIRLYPFREELHCFQLYKTASAYVFMVISTDLCCYYYCIGQLHIVRDILIASEMIIKDVMGLTPARNFNRLQEYARRVR